jgi:hypothetical protein
MQYGQPFYSLKLVSLDLVGEKSLSDNDHIELERHMINIEIVKSPGYAMVW